MFDDQASAEQAVRDLESHGFTQDQIGYAVRHLDSTADVSRTADGTLTTTDAPITDTITPRETDEHRGGTREGLVMGGITGVAFGSIVGAAAALLLPGIGPIVAGGILGAALTGAIAGAATGGIAGSLLHWGFSQEEADYYHSQFESGRTIVTVHAGARGQEAQEILSHNGGYNLNNRSAQMATDSDSQISTNSTTVITPTDNTNNQT
ncbi:MAG: hypothetical protein ABI670_12460 [Chloroflexota bacterium]